jgi:hypothetical protein
MHPQNSVDPLVPLLVRRRCGTISPRSKCDRSNTSTVSGSYVTNIANAAGVITVTYGPPKAHTNIQGARLSLVGGVNLNGDIAWQCGTNTVLPAGITFAGAPATTVQQKYLPSSCR